MNTAETRHRPANKLGALLARPGGKTREAAVQHADRELERYRSTAMTGLTEALDALDAICVRAAGRALSGGELETVLYYANRLSTISHAFQMREMSRAMTSLGSIAVSFIDRGPCPSRVVAVHLHAARWLLDNPGEDAAAIFEGLDGIAKKYAAPRPG